MKLWVDPRVFQDVFKKILFLSGSNPPRYPSAYSPVTLPTRFVVYWYMKWYLLWFSEYYANFRAQFFAHRISHITQMKWECHNEEQIVNIQSGADLAYFILLFVYAPVENQGQTKLVLELDKNSNHVPYEYKCRTLRLRRAGRYKSHHHAYAFTWSANRT